MALKTEENRYSQHYTNLASRRFGALALSCSDDFFAGMEEMLNLEPAVFITEKYTSRGKWMDGWESRRRRDGGHDWCVVRLGLPGLIRGIDVDTSFFLGNAPQMVSLQACGGAGTPDDHMPWSDILPRTAIEPGAHNLLDVDAGYCANCPPGGWTHVRLNIFPDGGVARLRVYGDVMPNWSWYLPGEPIDLAALENGARPLACTDSFFGPMENVLMPQRGSFMGDGWETRRRRGGRSCDWITVRLGADCVPCKVEVDTAHFKGNFPESFELEGACMLAGSSPDEQTVWHPLLSRTKLSADTQHRFRQELQNMEQTINHVRLKIYPDGGVSRLRVWGLRTDTPKDSPKDIRKDIEQEKV
jgi:allantoicase